MNFGISTR